VPGNPVDVTPDEEAVFRLLRNDRDLIDEPLPRPVNEDRSFPALLPQGDRRLRSIVRYLTLKTIKELLLHV
jgi:hypothetical protein